MKYTVYFELYNRKMKTEVEAGSIEQAKHIITNKIIFHKVVKSKDDDIVEHLKGVFGMR